MPRHQVKDNNWARLGQLVMDIWQQKQVGKGRYLRDALQESPTAVLSDYGVDLPKSVTKVEVHFDTKDHIHIVVPVRPDWSEEELKTVSRVEAYLRELGVVVMGGCK